MKLSDLDNGCQAVVHCYTAKGAALFRLREMGLIPGACLTLIRRAPLGGPLEISIRGSLLSLRKQEADLIECRPAT